MKNLIIASYLGVVLVVGLALQDSAKNNTLRTEQIAQAHEAFFTPPPKSASVPQKKQVFQTYNNCGPATLSMALSYFGIDVSQETLGEKLRPYQVSNGDNDDKSVTLEELAHEANNYHLKAYYRPNGSLTLLKTLIANGIPVITRTWLQSDEDIGHYRLIRGYDDETKEIVQDDSYQASDARYAYDDFSTMWEPFNNEYLVLVPDDKEELVKEILGKAVNERYAWNQALLTTTAKLAKDPENPNLLFNQSLAYYHLGEYKKAAATFEKAEPNLTSRRLWYQIEPILAYQNLGNTNRVFEMTDSILNNQNRAFSELYEMRGEMYLKRGEKDRAREEFEAALFYNKHFEKAKEMLQSLS